ncbi:pyruvate kinase [Gemella sanguinis]|jgi:pyruvate kinase|uniref:Pyruvate kinase n=1 Tax=Gemella sanguinis TaxID=84135 RepID=A0A2N6SGD7_9BACL|nr:pyruvate kinase [Gemella sanguinis]EGF86483.1 pyruvate kinase [Gemella sanguinis M325]PMC53005.1 pyruvate kinase [Gemella sanguinis]QGS07213.1 pyruvate kinase [Gemella sanguinis]
MVRKSKVIATLGLNTDSILEDIITSSVDAVLIDTYYGSEEENVERIKRVKELREKLNKNTAIIYDIDHIYAQSKYKLIKIDENNVDFACANDVDFIACPFVSNLDEIKKVKDILEKNNKKDIGLIVKVDCKEAYDNIDEIISFADSIMINRDELGVEVPYQDLPNVQKEIIRKANDNTKEVILTTQMLHSMIYNPRPTRAEVSDVANAIIDGVDAVMLIEETAIGNYPKEALETIDRIIKYVESQNSLTENDVKNSDQKMSIAHAISISTKHIIDSLDVNNIVTYTKSGSTAKFIAKYRPKVPVLAVVPTKEKARKLALTRGITTFIEPKTLMMDEMLENAALYSKESGLAKEGDYILITAGQPDLGKENTPPTDFVNVRRV